MEFDTNIASEHDRRIQLLNKRLSDLRAEHLALKDLCEKVLKKNNELREDNKYLLKEKHHG